MGSVQKSSKTLLVIVGSDLVVVMPVVVGIAVVVGEEVVVILISTGTAQMITRSKC